MYIFVKTTAVALHHADWSDISYNGGYEGSAVGLDCAGAIVAVAADGAMERTFQQR